MPMALDPIARSQRPTAHIEGWMASLYENSQIYKRIFLECASCIRIVYELRIQTLRAQYWPSSTARTRTNSISSIQVGQNEPTRANAHEECRLTGGEQLCSLARFQQR